MKKLFILFIMLNIASLILISCGGEEITELGWRNASTTPINEIVWAEIGGVWVKTNGYFAQEQTESKEVDILLGEVECTIFDGEEFVEANVTISETNSSSLVLSEGGSYIYTITAEPIAKK